VDDIASSGGTLAAAARALRRRGLARVDALVVHALFAPGALRRLRSAGIERVVSCDTVPHATNRIGVAPLLAGALMRERR
jgi:ribose-phosphate pyrophosphokinase